jgi:hypothetical protein
MNRGLNAQSVPGRVVQQEQLGGLVTIQIGQRITGGSLDAAMRVCNIPPLPYRFRNRFAFELNFLRILAFAV